MPQVNEFDLIAQYFAPLAAGFPGSLNLSDDAALLDVPAGQQLVVTKDAIVSGVHFIGDEDAALIAQKLLRVNLSDLAAMGAEPLAYTLAIMLPKDIDSKWLERFAAGLAQDQKTFGISLIGGDTVSTPGVLSFSLTAFGLVPTGAALRRNGAKVGDKVYVSGTIGDSAVGLKIFKNMLAKNDFLQGRYLLPQPRLALGQSLRGVASSCMDISDGLLQDLAHICKASGVGATIRLMDIPLSPDVAAWMPQLWETVVAGGDDYELLFTSSQDVQGATCIGEIVEGDVVTLLDVMGNSMPYPKGFSHF